MIDHEREQAMEEKAFATGPSDAERLDWLQSQMRVGIAAYSVNGTNTVKAWGSELVICARGDTLREAIDRAMAQEKATQGNVARTGAVVEEGTVR